MEPIHDIFISHSPLDEQPVRGLARRLREWGFDVQVDYDEPALRKPADPELAARLKRRFGAARILLFAFSSTPANSKWMPWQLGLAQGAAATVALWPLDDGAKWTPRTREYLGLYEKLDAENAQAFLEKLVGERRAGAPASAPAPAPAPVDAAEEPANTTVENAAPSNQPDAFTELVLKGPAQFYAAWLNAFMGKR